MKEIALGEGLYEYVVTRFAVEERELLRSMLGRARAAGLPEIQISEEQAKFLRMLVKIAGAKDALDVGTLFGFSAAVMALGMGPQGRVVTLELDPRAADVARANLSSLGLDARVDVRVGPALEAMRALPARSLDVVHIDADKANYVHYLEEAVRLLRDGGLVLGDNAFAFGRLLDQAPDEDVRAIRAFNDAIARHPRLESVIVPVGDGLALARVVRA